MSDPLALSNVVSSVARTVVDRVLRRSVETGRTVRVNYILTSMVSDSNPGTPVSFSDPEHPLMSLITMPVNTGSCTVWALYCGLSGTGMTYRKCLGLVSNVSGSFFCFKVY